MVSGFVERSTGAGGGALCSPGAQIDGDPFPGPLPHGPLSSRGSGDGAPGAWTLAPISRRRSRSEAGLPAPWARAGSCSLIRAPCRPAPGAPDPRRP